MKIYDVVILGAGASGLMCASQLHKSLSVAIVEGNDKIAKKLKISGGGKCNITNVDVSLYHYDTEDILLSNTLDLFGKEELLSFLHNNGVSTEIRKERYYFCQKSSQEIISVFQKKIEKQELYLNHKIISVKKEKDLFLIQTDKKLLKATKVVVATGGKSYKKIGASEIGLEIAKSFGLKVTPFSPALVGLTVQKEQFWMKELSGLSCFANIKVEGKTLEEELLFTHKGISGPLVLSASLYWKKGEISINFLPNYELQNIFRGGKKLISSVLPLPKRLSKSLLEVLQVQDLACNKITQESFKKLSKIQDYSFAPAGNFGFEKAEVSKGGVCKNGLNAYTCETLDVKGLYFIGEVVDITGELGGYNFQWAFGSGFVCAKSFNEN